MNKEFYNFSNIAIQILPILLLLLLAVYLNLKVIERYPPFVTSVKENDEVYISKGFYPSDIDKPHEQNLTKLESMINTVLLFSD
ncbi:hypothetical protein I8752_26905 [Nostocaceae cyanobacterium CENA369]|uniref:Uncharacterized protein n=1 Tax=Dendronalium phyllosphericum CENA369 TaxID=1725256 RepID=A0A8J7I5U5_9NOST|nr:hypothetical protein [Dendronalium phyllosphericum]MBH8576555.1 hypothetical protein [Dendronalium phyllosphericum CENA369]